MKKVILACCLIAAFIFEAWGQYYHYIPNTANIPALSGKGDLNLGIGWGRGVFQGIETQVAYSPFNHLAVMANYFASGNKHARNQTEQGTDYKFWEVAVGAYETLPKGFASLNAGFGSGSVFCNYPNNRSADLGLQRWFLQPGITYQSSYFQAALALRLSMLTYSRGNVDFTIDDYNIQFVKNLEKYSPFFLPELCMKAGIILKPVLISVGVTTIFPNTSDLAFIRLNTSLSIAVQFGTLKKKQQQ